MAVLHAVRRCLPSAAGRAQAGQRQPRGAEGPGPALGHSTACSGSPLAPLSSPGVGFPPTPGTGGSQPRARVHRGRAGSLREKQGLYQQTSFSSVAEEASPVLQGSVAGPALSQRPAGRGAAGLSHLLPAARAITLYAITTIYLWYVLIYNIHRVR